MLHSRRILLSVLGFLLMLLSGCAYTQHSIGPTKDLYEKPALSDRFCVMFPPDFAGGSRVYFDQGRADPESTVGERVFRAIYSNRPSSVLIETSDEDRAIQECLSRNARYLLSPRIIQWQGRASAWSLRTNVVEVEIRLVRVKPNTLIRSAFFQASNGWFNSGSDDPALLMFDDSFTRTIIELVD